MGRTVESLPVLPSNFVVPKEPYSRLVRKPSSQETILRLNAINAAVADAQGGKTEAFGTVYELTHGRISKFVQNRIQREEDSQDVVSETYTRAMEHIGSYSPQGTFPFEAWLFAIARHIIVDQARRDSRRRELPIEDRDESIVGFRDVDEINPSVDPFDRQWLGQAINSLPDAQRDVISIRFDGEEGVSVAGTARLLGKTENNVKVLQHKAIGKLRAQHNQRPGAA